MFLPHFAEAANINFSLEAWIKPTTSIATKAILVKNNEMRLVTDASGYLVCQIHNGADWQTAANSGVAIELNKWSQAGCSYNGLNLKVYINGVLKGTTAMTADVQNTTNNFFAGKDAGGTYGRFEGTMDSIAIYDDALTSQEIADHYSRGNLYKDENNNLKFEIGGLNLSYDISSWTSGGWHMITALWNPDGINQVSGSDMLYGNLFVDGVSAASSSTSFTSASSTPSTFYFAQDSQNSGQFNGTIYGLQLDENNWKAADITTAYNSGTGIAPVASGETNFTLSTASSTDVVAWQHSGSLANDGNFEDGDAAEFTSGENADASAQGGTVADESGLAGGWNFEESSTPAIDVSGNSNSLIWNGTAARVSGKYGYAIDLDGDSDYLNKTDADSLDLTDATIEAWIKLDDLAAQHSLADKGTNYGVHIDTSGYLTWDNGTEYKDTTAISAETWTHIAVTNDGTTAKYYVNGAYSSSDTAGLAAVNASDLRIGYDGTNYFQGLIDSLRIYSSALGADEIRAMYERGYSDHYGAKIRLSADDAQSYINSNASLSNGGNYLLSFDYRLGEENINPINFTIRDGSGENTAEKNLLGSSVTGLVGAWNFEESATPAVDLSGNSNSGVWNGNTTYSNTGKFGKAISLDGTGDYLNHTSNNLTPSVFSIEAWVKSLANNLSQGIVTKMNQGVSPTKYAGYLLAKHSGNKWIFWIGQQDDSTGITYSDSESTDTGWHYLTGVYDGAKSMIYVDGIKQSDEDSRTIAHTSDNFMIGRYYTDLGSLCFNGLIDSVRIYNRALSPEEVYESYKKGLWHKYELSFEADEAATHLFRFIQNGSTSGDSILYVDNFDLQTNLVDNGGMEGTYTSGKAAGWINFGEGETPSESSSSHLGAKAQQLAVSSGSDNPRMQGDPYFNMSSGWYTFSAWIKSSITTANALRLRISNGEGTYTYKDFTAPDTSNYYKYSHTFYSSGDTTAYYQVVFLADGTFLIDDVSLVALGSNSATVAASTAAFTPAFGYRPGKVSGENALPITLSDNLQFDEGGQMGTGSAELAYENFDPFGGTIKTWVRPSWDGTDTGTHVILEDKNGTDYFKLYYSNGNLYWDVYRTDTTYRVYQSASAWTAGTWYHVTATWSNQNTVNADATGYISNLYINGSDSGNTYSNVTAGTNFWTAFAPGTIYIGESSTPDSRWNGLLEGLSILNSPLSESEIASDYNSGSGTLSSADANTIFYLPANSSDPDGMIRWHLKNYREVTANESGLVGGWNFESAATDVTGTYTGSWTGSAAYVAGKNGNAADFDGSTDYIDLGDIGF